MKFDKFQEDFLKHKGDKILCCGRQVGKSTICSIDAGEWAITHKNSNVLMIAPTERQARALFEKTLAYLVDKYPKHIRRGKNRPTKELIKLTNNVNIYCLPVGLAGIGIRFLTVHRLYVDEASRVPEEVWSAVTPMLLTTGGDTILLSTPFGTKGEFYRTWVNKDDAYRSFKRFSATSEIIMKERPICETWTAKQREKALLKLEQEKARMSRREYAQEYLGEFIEDLMRYFPDELIKRCCTLKRRGGIPQGNYYLGVDIARMGDDESTFEILDKQMGQIVHVENMVTKKTLTTDT